MGIGTEEETAFAFDGDWRELAPILFTNLMLSIVTLGFYRFWGIARERRYLWSKTRFIDDRLEWTGTGKELFLGFLLVIAILFVPLFLLQFVAQALILRGHAAFAGVLALSVYLVFFYVAGLAIFLARNPGRQRRSGLWLWLVLYLEDDRRILCSRAAHSLVDDEPVERTLEPDELRTAQFRIRSRMGRPDAALPAVLSCARRGTDRRDRGWKGQRLGQRLFSLHRDPLRRKL